MEEKEHFNLTAKDGTSLIGYEWLVDEPKAVICMVHGLGEHMGRYDHVAAHFNAQAISFFGFDLRGHGLSEGKRGHTPSFDILLDDIEEMLMYARAEYNDAPIFLYGHSLGGNLVTNYILRKNINELQGAIISSPWLKLAEEPPKSKVKLARLMNGLWPSFSESNQLDINKLTNEDAINQAYKNDPLVHDKISARMFVECYQNGLWALDHVDRNKIPVLMFHGTEDKITSAEGSQEFADKAGDQVTYKQWKVTKHEPHNDISKKEVLENISKWVGQEIAAKVISKMISP